MARRISQLTALTSASLDTTLLGIDRGVSYKIELDVLADAVKDRINTLDDIRLDSLENFTASYTASTISNGTISGSSQLTASFDQRYTLSGSVTQTTWDNISGKPSGIVSQSTNLTSLNQFTQSIDSRVDSLENATSSYLTSLNGAISSSSQLTSSYDNRYFLNSKSASLATTGSNTFIGNQKITGSVSILIPGGTATGLNENPTSNNVFWSYSTTDTNTTAVQIGWAAEVVGGGTYTVTNVQVDTPFAPFIAITLSDGSLTLPYRCRINFSKSSKLWEFNSNGTLTGLPDGLISGSSQLTSSYDGRYVLSGSITQTTWDNISGKPSGIVSQSTDLSSINAFTQSIDNRVDSLESWSSSLTNTFATDLEVSIVSSSVAATIGIISTNAGLVTTSSFNSYTASISTGSLVNRLNAIESLSSSWITESETGSFLTSLNGAISSSSQLTSSFDIRYTLSGSVQPLPSNLVSSSAQITAFGFVSSSATIPAGTISSSAQITSLGFVSGSYLTSLSGAISSSVQVLGGTGIYSSSAQLPSGLISGSSQLPLGIVSGSSQLTSSLDLRYQLSGSAGVVPAGTISSSAQLTSSFDSRYVLETETGSLQNSITSLNTLTSSLATTGSNSFNGNQIVTGSLTVSSIATISASIAANASALTLSSGSNFYIQNNGLAEITGSLVVSGSTINLITTVLQVGTGSGDEGGEILLAKSQTNNSLTGSGVTIDSFQNRLRIFEQGGDARGVHIDLTKAPAGVNGELLWKASNIVNAGTFVTLDNIKATVTTTSNRGLSLATVAGTVTGYISGHYVLLSGSPNGGVSTTSLSTTATSSMFSWNFTNQGDTSTYILRDDTNNRVYRITLLIGGSYNNNFISIERLF